MAVTSPVASRSSSRRKRGELCLKTPDEPVELLGSLRELAGRAPGQARKEAPSRLAEHVWPLWQELASRPAGRLELADVERAFATAEREIWLWIRGNRRWGQLDSHLVARVRRRLDAAS